MSPPSNSDSKPPSESTDHEHDQLFFVSFGLIVSARFLDVEKIRKAVEGAGGKIAFQTVTKEPLYLLRHYEVEQIVQGDVDQMKELAELHNRKSKERRVEK